MSREERAYRKINRILSKLDPDVAAGLARRLMDSYGRAVTAPMPAAIPAAQNRAAPSQEAGRPAPTPADRSVPVPPVQPASEDNRPSFLQTQYRMEVGKRLVEYLNKEESRKND